MFANLSGLGKSLLEMNILDVFFFFTVSNCYRIKIRNVSHEIS